MKKTIAFILTSVLVVMIALTGSSFAASLDNVTIDTSKTTVHPGEQVKLTIKFGKALSAYTFKIAYDHNLFSFVSVDDAEVNTNDTGDKLIAEFHDSKGGANPRSNVSINFKAKSDIVTSNPTELTVVGEGFASVEGGTTVTYDDITTPMVKNITVEPDFKDYVLKLEYTGEIIAKQEKDMTLSYSSTMGRPYEHARLIAEATTPAGANVKLMATNSAMQVEQDIIESGWGDPQGYKIGGKDVSQVLKVKGLFTEVGDYKITLKLIDRDNSDSVIAEKQFSLKVVEKETNGTTGTDKEEPTKKPTTTENKKPTTLPKTGNNIYAPIAFLIATLGGCAYCYNKKNND